MGATVRFWKGAWWVFVNHHKQRRAKRCADEATAHRVAKAIREAIARAVRAGCRMGKRYAVWTRSTQPRCNQQQYCKPFERQVSPLE